MRLIVVAALVLGAAAGVVACSSNESIVVQNNTKHTVVVYEDGQPTTLIGPGISRDFNTGEFRGTLSYEIRQFCEKSDCNQDTLAQRTFTWEEIKQAGGVRLTVEPAALGER